MLAASLLGRSRASLSFSPSEFGARCTCVYQDHLAMSSPFRVTALRCYSHASRTSSSSSAPLIAIAPPRQAPRRSSRRWQSTAAANPKISGIVDQIGQLTLLETADLVGLLKVDR